MSKIWRQPAKLGLMPKMLLACLFVTLICALYFMYYAMPKWQGALMDSDRDEARSNAEIIWSVVNHWHDLEISGAITAGEAQAAALAEIESLSFDSGDQEQHPWVIDYQPVLLADATRSYEINTYVGDIADLRGDYIYSEAVDICRNEGEGLLEVHELSQVGESQGSAVSKPTYVKEFQPWGWIVGMTSYDAATDAMYHAMRVEARLLLGAVGVVALIVFWVFARYTVTKPLASLVRTSEALARGDVDQEINIKSGDEIGRLATAYSGVVDYMKEMAQVTRQVAAGDLTVDVSPKSDKDTLGNAFSQLVGQQRELIGKLKAAATDVSEASVQLSKASEQTAQAVQQIATTIQQVARGASDQSSSFEVTIAGMSGLSEAIVQIARGAQEQAKGVEHATGIAKQLSAAIVQVSANAQAGGASWKSTSGSAAEGARMTHDTIEGMTKIKDAMDLVALKMDDLGRRSGEIGNIVATIDDIAAQTNLLALNAAIEAARAGEQGRGFAVVADEVRRLAERASAATKEITFLVDGIQTGVKEATKAMEQGSEEVATGYKLATDAGGALDAILEMSRDVSVQVDSILEAAEELTTLNKNMVETIERINRIVEQNSDATDRMVQTSKTVSQSVDNSGDVARQNSAAAQEVSASVEEMSAQAEEALAAAQSLADMSVDMSRAVEVFKVGTERNTRWGPKRSS